jgi:hypothetical protein
VEQVGGGFAGAGSGVADGEEVGDVTQFEPESLSSLDESLSSVDEEETGDGGGGRVACGFDTRAGSLRGGAADGVGRGVGRV